MAEILTNPERLGEPVWEIAELFPAQGQWSEEEYLALETNRIVEFDNGYVEVPPLPTQRHQLIITLLYRLLHDFAAPQQLGIVLLAALSVQLWEGKYREPDIVFMLAEHNHRRHDNFWEGADLVMEVVSPGAKNRERDLVIKPREYAQASIPEYWIIDPETETITVLRLTEERYEEHGVFGRGHVATSVLLSGFAVSVEVIFDVE